MLAIYYLQEIEEQRRGRNKDTTINHNYINSGQYRKKFDCISDNLKLNRLLYSLAKKMLFHRSGTLYEDMYWIDLDTLEIVADETNKDIEEGIIYSAKTQKIIETNKNLLTIHSHPNSFPPSIMDLNCNFYYNYSIGIIICHNGKIYMYNANEKISRNYYDLTVAEYIKQGYNDNEAQVLALLELQEKFDVQIKEVTDNDV